jgi:hypothetical protein
MPQNWRWLVLEGILPLFGASVLYLLLGMGRWVSYQKSAGASFTFAWKEALDSFGWLYGATVIAAQSAKKLFAASGVSSSVGWMNVIAGAMCVLVLIAGMLNRGETAGWKPPPRFHVTSII